MDPNRYPGTHFIFSEATFNIEAENVATDLESFSNHAGRTTVTTDDVLLLARKNPDLHQIMKEHIDRAKAEKEALKGKGASKGKR